MILPPEILKKVKLLELKTRKLVSNVLTGEYRSAFKGQGMTFSDFREYVHGDDVRHISWNMTAKAGKPYIKQYDEERELSCLLVVDISGSADYGSGEYLKGELMIHLAALIGFSAIASGDPVGLCLFSDEVEHFVPPKKGRANIHRILRDLYYFRPRSKKTNIKNSLSYLQGILKKQTNVFILSDFIDEGFDVSLRRLAKKHDVTAIVVEDKSEWQLPKLGYLNILDPETGESAVVNTSSTAFQKKMNALSSTRRNQLEKTFRRLGIGSVFIDDPKDYVDPLIAYFQTRHR